MLRRHDVEERVIAGAVEDHLAVTGGRDRDRPLRCAFERERHRAVERCHLRIDIVQPLGACRGRRASGSYRPAGRAVPRRRSSRPVPRRNTRAAGWRSSAPDGCPGSRGGRRGAFALRGRSLRLASRPDAHDLDRLARGAVGIRQLEAALVFGPRAQVEDAAGESIGHRVVEVLALPVHIARRRSGPAATPSASRLRPPPGTAPSTVAFRFASPRIDHSNPRFRSVGCSTTNVPASVAFWALAEAAANTRTAAIRGILTVTVVASRFRPPSSSRIGGRSSVVGWRTSPRRLDRSQMDAPV